MKQLSLLLAFICILSVCEAQQRGNVKKVAEGIKEQRKAHTLGSIATSPNGYYMRRKVDGKDWVAPFMMPLNVDDRVLGYTANGGYIGIPSIRANIQQGFKLTLGKTRNADINIVGDKTLIDKDGNVILLDKQEGKVEITKRDGEWVEGTFHFTSSSSTANKKVQVTDGVFRTR